MADRYEYDAIIVGSGPNGLAAAITLAQQGKKVCVYEMKDTVGGGMRTAELTLPGFHHDVCSAIHPMGAGSPFFRHLPLTDFGLKWIEPDIQLAHPLENGEVAALYRSIDETAATLGRDAGQYRRLMNPLVDRWQAIMDEILRPLRLPTLPHLIPMALFGIGAGLPATVFNTVWFRGETARTFFGGLAAHSFLRMDDLASASFGLVLGILGHATGWPIPEGGSQQIADAMVRYLCSMNGQVVLEHEVTSLDQLPPAKAVFFNTSPKALVRIAGDRLPQGYKRKLENYRHGPGVFKVDWALSEPIPWKNEACRRAGTVHLGGNFAEIVQSERDAWGGNHAERPYVLLAQQSLFDGMRAPEDKHTAWGYCHVPSGSTVDMTDAIENQIERYAPGFKDCILERHTMSAMDYQKYNPNYVGGDINGGVQDLFQLAARPVIKRNPYRTPANGLYLCSAATSPGGGVHGMAGYLAAQSAMKDIDWH